MPIPVLHIRKTFSHGIYPPEEKGATCSLPIRRLPFAPELIVPLSQHTGAPAVPCVSEGVEVVRGEPIAQPGGFVSVPMHAPGTGTVLRIDRVRSAKGDMVRSIIIRTYSGASQEILYGAPQDVESMTPDELVNAVQQTGVVGLGGAAFPTHVKLKVPAGKRIDTVIVNGCECEPYLTTDHRVMLEYADQIHEGIRVVQKAVGAERAIIAVEDNKLDAAEALRVSPRAAQTTSVVVLKTHYPQGAEKMLVKLVLNHEVPSGGLPSDVGAAVFNVATLAQIGDLLPRSQGLIERVVTIAGDGVAHPGNYLMALGTPLRFALEHAGLKPGACEVILGGPMMGPAVADTNVPITKGVTGILVLSKEKLSRADRKEYPCIKCGHCVDACPVHLNPSRLGLLARVGMHEEMEKHFHLNDCFECGSCAYVCPSHIPLVQHFRIAKQLNRERRASS
ncbi:MAG TPA: electron transport complex subunit RsxC [Candidatus Hydrogenedentes bacterium]|nr:electron transport complex subunit RsxC [Candidatus Hydrogenedentota bacterium]HRK33539.1 electron transport complex subunit RsxC [Candidatus Hydrogenedentota bacterium]